MDEWTPLLVLPNAQMLVPFVCEQAAIVSVEDERVVKLRADHPTLEAFLSKFSGQFDEQVWPSLLLLRTDAPRSFYTAEAVGAFRDILSLSTVPNARTLRLRFKRASILAFTNTFQFYPWMIDNKFENVILSNPANRAFHLLSEFKGQCFPELGQAPIGQSNVDWPLAEELLKRWCTRFSESVPNWQDKTLFRSLNMANEAGRIPAPSIGVFYDAGRSLALWVSAYEILAHPGEGGQSNFSEVSALLEKVQWRKRELTDEVHTISVNPPQQKQLATWVCRKIYDLRNDFLHGNNVEADALFINKRPAVDFAGCLFRLALTGLLDLRFKEPQPPLDDVTATDKFMGRQMWFNKFQRAFEDALLTAIEREGP